MWKWLNSLFSRGEGKAGVLKKYGKIPPKPKIKTPTVGIIMTPDEYEKVKKVIKRGVKPVE